MDPMENEPNNNDQEEDFQILAEDHYSSPQDIYFDEVVAALQEIIFDQSFEDVQGKFMKKYCSCFEDSEQNKNEYMEVFNLYQQQIEQFIKQNLAQRIDKFDMNNFLVLLQARTDQIDEQILDMLESFTDFQVFKNLMLEYKSYLLNQDNLKSLSVRSNRLA